MLHHQVDKRNGTTSSRFITLERSSCLLSSMFSTSRCAFPTQPTIRAHAPRFPGPSYGSHLRVVKSESAGAIALLGNKMKAGAAAAVPLVTSQAAAAPTARTWWHMHAQQLTRHHCPSPCDRSFPNTYHLTIRPWPFGLLPPPTRMPPCHLPSSTMQEPCRHDKLWTFPRTPVKVALDFVYILLSPSLSCPTLYFPTFFTQTIGVL